MTRGPCSDSRRRARGWVHAPSYWRCGAPGSTDVIANAPADRIVIHDGVVVSRSETRTWMAV